MTVLKRTPIFSEYEEQKAKTIDFGGWEMPVSFSGILKEHQAVRETAGMFDVSHMGEIMVEGKGSLAFLQKMTTNNAANLVPGKAQYTFMCNQQGGTIDDFLLYKLNENSYMLVVNAANIEKDLKWLKQHQGNEEVNITDNSDECALLAVQGPLAVKIVQRMTNEDIKDIKPFRFRQYIMLKTVEHPALISRTGYTGEDGVEIYIHKDSAADLWRKILKEGECEGLIAAGLGARDTLRFEAGLPLYGQELSESISPLEAGISFAVKLDKKVKFIGYDALKEEKESGTERKLAGLELVDKGIARTDHEVFSEAGEKIGTVTTGTKSPTLDKSIALALLNNSYLSEGKPVVVQVRNKRLKAKVTNIPFYKR